jgi:catalase (peroxidase I)
MIYTLFKVNGRPTMMLTSDLALLEDEEFSKLAYEYYQDIESLNKDFGEAWYKLTTHDMGPANRCKGNLSQPPRPFQHTV